MLKGKLLPSAASSCDIFLVAVVTCPITLMSPGKCFYLWSARIYFSCWGTTISDCPVHWKITLKGSPLQYNVRKCLRKTCMEFCNAYHLCSFFIFSSLHFSRTCTQKTFQIPPSPVYILTLVFTFTWFPEHLLLKIWEIFFFPELFKLFSNVPKNT